MVGEIRDHETLEIAINASLTGHLVLSTIHTNDAAGAVTRMVDMGVEPFLIRSSVIGILAQRLIRVLCTHCKYSYPAEDFELEELGLTPERMRFRAARRNNPASRYFPRNVSGGDLFEEFDITRRPMFSKAKGCNQCTSTGFIGRKGIYELLLVDDAVGPLILRRADAQAIKRAAQDMGMDTLRDDGARKVLAGMTTVEEVLAATQDDVEGEHRFLATQRRPERLGDRGGVGHGRLRVQGDPQRQRQAGSRHPRRRQRQGASRRPEARRHPAHQRARGAQGPRAGGRKSDGGFSLFNRVSIDDVAMMTRQLATLVGAGIPLVESVTALTEQMDKLELKRILDAGGRHAQRGQLPRQGARRPPARLLEPVREHGRGGRSVGQPRGRARAPGGLSRRGNPS